MIKVELISRQSLIRIKKDKILRLTKKTLRMHGVRKASLNLVFVDNKSIRALNRRYLGRDCATDVLCFNYKWKHAPDAEIIVSCQMAVQQAQLRRISRQEELLRYIIHGILHYLGYKDNTRNARSQMSKVQEEFLRSFGLINKSLVANQRWTR